MAKLLLWICAGIGGTVGSVIPLMFSQSNIGWSIFYSTVGGIVGIWFWWRFLRFA